MEDRLRNIENTLAEMRKEQSLMAKSLDRLAEVATEQIKQYELIRHAKEDIEVLFGKFRDIESKGINACNLNSEKIKNLEGKIEKMENRAWQIWLLFAAQIVQFLFLVIKKGV